MRYFIYSFFLIELLKRGVYFTLNSTSQFRPTVFQSAQQLQWLVATILHSKDLCFSEFCCIYYIYNV